MTNSREIQPALGAVFVGAALLLGVRQARASGPRLLVFLHLPLKQRALEKELGSALPGVEVTTVGRIADLDRALESGQDGVLSLPIVLAEKGLTPKLRGFRGGASDEPYALVGADRAPDPQKVSAVGVLDLLGRTKTAEFVRTLTGTAPRIERVTKVEDLLALLQMQRVDAIILAARLVSELRQMTRLNLVQTELLTRVGLPAVSASGPGASAVLAAVGKMDQTTLNVLGIDAWR